MKAIILASLLLATTPAQALTPDGSDTVGEMLTMCRIALGDVEQMPTRSVADAFSCVGKLRGYLDGLGMAGMICDEVEIGHLRLPLVYIKWASALLIEDQSKEGENWQVAMFAAVMNEGWLCPGAIEQIDENLRRRDEIIRERD